MQRRRFPLLKIAAVLLCVGLAIVSFVYVRAPRTPRVYHPHKLTQSERAAFAKLKSDPKFVASNNEFSLRCLQELVAMEPGHNVVVSALNLRMCLSMVLNGAAGDTRTAIEKALEATGLGCDKLNEMNKALLTAMGGFGSDARMTAANSLWLDDGFSVRSDFRKRISDCYSAQVGLVDFSTPASIRTIDAWTREATNGRIDKCGIRFDPDCVAVLASAMTFDGTWGHPFDPADTESKPFRLADGTQVDVPMMFRKGKFDHFASRPGRVVSERLGEIETITLPYGRGDMRMTIILPDHKGSVSDLVKNLDPYYLEAWASLGSHRGSISLPRFTVDYDAREQIKQAMRQLGMGIAFTSRADFSGMSSTRLSIGQLAHRTVVKVDEEGTEAATVSASAPMIGGPLSPFNMVVDRPFLFLIRDYRTGLIWFIGVVTDPR